MVDNKFKWEDKMQKLKAMHSALPIVLANVTKQHFVGAFREQGWEGQPWAVPKRRIEGTPEYKYPKYRGLGRRTQSTLIRTGRLLRAVNTSLRSATFEQITFIIDVPYAGYNNYGTDKIPARSFVKDGILLRAKQMEVINKHVKKIFE